MKGTFHTRVLSVTNLITLRVSQPPAKIFTQVYVVKHIKHLGQRVQPRPARLADLLHPRLPLRHVDDVELDVLPGDEVAVGDVVPPAGGPGLHLGDGEEAGPGVEVGDLADDGVGAAVADGVLAQPEELEEVISIIAGSRFSRVKG